MGIKKELELYSVHCDTCHKLLSPADCGQTAESWWRLTPDVALSEGFANTYKLLRVMGWYAGTWEILCPTCSSRKTGIHKTDDYVAGRHVSATIDHTDGPGVCSPGIFIPSDNIQNL